MHWLIPTIIACVPPGPGGLVQVKENPVLAFGLGLRKYISSFVGGFPTLGSALP